jgi:hypothetical protein
VRHLLTIVLLLFYVAQAEGATYYADGGSPSGCIDGSTNYNPIPRTCSGGASNTVYIGTDAVQQASYVMAPGDTLTIRGSPTFTGTYTGIGGDGSIVPRSGNNISNRTTYQSYLTEVPRFRGFKEGLVHPSGTTSAESGRYVHILGNVRKAGMLFDMENIFHSINTNNMEFSRFENIEIKNGGEQAFLAVNNNEFISLNVHHIGYNGNVAFPPEDNTFHACELPGINRCHAFYGGQDSLFDDVEIHDVTGYGIHCTFPCNGVTVRNSLIYDTGGPAIYFQGGATNANTVYNVVAYNNAGPAVWNEYGATNVYHVTASANNTGGGGQADIEVTASSAVRNSIAIPTGVNASPTISNNVTTGAAASHFVDFATGNFNLISTSTAVNKVGANICLASVTTDYAATVRPQGSNCDIGAYEFTTGTPQPTAPVATITTPTSAANTSTTSATTALGGTASDTDGTVSSVAWTCSTCTPTSGTATGTTTWSVASIGLALGGNTIVVTATDNSSQTGMDTIVISRAAPSPANILLAAMDENTGSSVADTSGNSNTGTFTGTGVSWTTAGKYGAGITFTGLGYVSVADSASLDIAGQFSAMAWVRPNSNVGWQTIFYKADATSGYVIGLYASVGSVCTAGRVLAVVTTSVAQYSACSTAALSTTALTHVASTYDGSNLILYINGAANATTPASGTISAGTGTLRIGSSVYDEFFSGVIDEAQIRGVALTAGEIVTAAATRVTSPPQPAPPVGIRLSALSGFKCPAGPATSCIRIGTIETEVPAVDSIFLQEGGDHLLLETADELLLE